MRSSSIFRMTRPPVRSPDGVPYRDVCPQRKWGPHGCAEMGSAGLQRSRCRHSHHAPCFKGRGPALIVELHDGMHVITRSVATTVGAIGSGAPSLLSGEPVGKSHTFSDPEVSSPVVANTSHRDAGPGCTCSPFSQTMISASWCPARPSPQPPERCFSGLNRSCSRFVPI